jgi:hypothetical protein
LMLELAKNIRKTKRNIVPEAISLTSLILPRLRSWLNNSVRRYGLCLSLSISFELSALNFKLLND